MGCAVPLVVVCHCPALAGFEGQAGLGTVERLDLALLVYREHHRMRRRMHVEADNILDFSGEGGVPGALEGTQPVGLEVVRLPDALHRGERQLRGLGHGPAGPMGDLARRFAAGQRHDLSHLRQRHRRLARLAAAVAKQPLDAALGVMPLPTPYRRTADRRPARDLRRRQPVTRIEHDPRALHVLEEAIAVADNRDQSRAIFSRNNHRNRLAHVPSFAQPGRSVNPMIGSVH